MTNTERAAAQIAAPVRRVLLVDDDRDFADSVARLLEARGYQAVSAYSSKQACDAARQFPAQVALIDVRLGSENGIELVRELKGIHPDMLCVMITAYADLENAIQALQQGAYDYLRKPVSPPALFAALDRCFERLSLQRERDLLEAQLRQAQKLEAVGQLAAGVAHDLNNVFFAIMNMAYTARLAPAEHDKVVQALDDIVDVTERATGFTRSLLTFSRQAPVEKSPVHLGQAVAKTIRLLRGMLPAAIEIVADVSTSAPELWVEADVTQLQQIVLNLAVNARDAMPEGGELRIVARHRPVDSADVLSAVSTRGRGAALLIVEDAGVGMPEEVRARVFEPFFTTKSPEHGAGLGMSVIYGIVSAHHGQIEVESQEGQGTRVTVALPCCEPPQTVAGSSAAEALQPGRGETILVAEDDEQARRIITSSLRSAGYDVVEASDGVEATSVFEKRQALLRLVVLDLDLPRKSGLACLTQMRRLQPDIPVLIVTGTADPGLEKQLDSRTQVLHKPFLMNDLMKRISQTLAPALQSAGKSSMSDPSIVRTSRSGRSDRPSTAAGESP